MKKGLLLFAAGLFNLAAITAQVQPVQPKLTDDKSFSMILLPDPQSYTKFDVNQPLFELMTAWTANNKERLNIEAVLCTGDLVEQNEIRIPDGVNGNQTSEDKGKLLRKPLPDWIINCLMLSVPGIMTTDTKKRKTVYAGYRNISRQKETPAGETHWSK